MKLLVTGGAGFIGSNFIRYWFKENPQDNIVNVDLLTYAGNLDNLDDVSRNPNYRFVKGDICDGSLVETLMEDIDVVVHFAAESHVDRSILEPSVFTRTNVVGTQTLLEAALSHNVKRFHHISTDEVFGSLDLTSPNKFNEETPYNPRSPYSASKAASDHFVRSYHTTYGLPVTITNCSNNFGPYQHPEKFIPLAITNILEGKKVPVYGDGQNVRDWLHVEDHVKAIEMVIKKGNVGETYCVGGMQEDTSNLNVVKKIIKIMGKDESIIEFIKDRRGHDRKYAIDWTKIHTTLAWKPVRKFDSWLEYTISWYKDNEAWWKKLKDSSFQQYYQKQYA